MLNRRVFRGFLVVAIALAAGLPAAATDIPLTNWPAPATWSPQASSGAGRTALTDLTMMLPFTAVTPCRVVDTRVANGAFGSPWLLSGAARTFNLPVGPCAGIPATAGAYSLNFTVTTTAGPGYITAWPAGGALPLVSTLTYLAAQTVSNAAIVPAGTSGGISVVAAGSRTNLIIDINGYYSPSPSGVGYVKSETSGPFAGYFSTTGGFDSIYTECIGPTPCWAIEAKADEAGTGYSGHFTGANGLFSSVTKANAVAVQGTSIAGSGARFTTHKLTGQVGGVVGIAPGAVVDNVFGLAGVRGISGNFGTLGLSTSLGAGGFHVSATGALESGSYLGYTTTIGLHTIGTTSATGVKNFIEPHPTDPTKAIRYTSLEGPEAGTYFRGRGVFEGRRVVIDVPEDFRLVTDAEGLSIQVTPIGELATVAVVSIDTDRIVLKSSRDVPFFYTVNGVRKSFKDVGPIVDGQIFFMPDSPRATMPLAYSDEQRRALIENGTYNADGTPNMYTAERVGWARVWQEREERARADAARAALQEEIPHHD